MIKYESMNYTFFYQHNSKAESDIKAIAAYQEECFQSICDILKVRPDFKIQYFLCNSPEEVGIIYGDNEPCNGFADLPDKVYAVYNDRIKCIGFHEDAHLISNLISYPDAVAIREGLAMYFDRKWWGIQNLNWVLYYLKNDRYISIDKLINNGIFYDNDCSITYPIVGAFTDYLITAYGMDCYLAFYKNKASERAMKEIFKKSPMDLDHEFTAYAKLSVLDADLEARMDRLLNE